MMYPGLASWAKLNRPCGTKFVNPGSHAGVLAREAKQATEKFGTGQERRTSGAKARVVVELLRPD